MLIKFSVTLTKKNNYYIFKSKRPNQILIKDYINSRKKKIMTKKVSKYVAAFDCFDKTLINLFASRGINFISFANVIGIPVASGSFIFAFSLRTGVIKKLFKIARKKKKKSN